MQIDCVITSVGYDDFLRIILPYTMPHFSNIYVVTTKEDQKTKECCGDFGIRCIQTAAWSYGSGVLNKGRALNVALKASKAQWVCSMDADIILPPDFTDCFGDLDEDVLYSAHRHMCGSKLRFMEWQDLSGWDISMFDIHKIPIRDHGDGLIMWRNKNAGANAAGVYGYLQLWNQNTNRFQFPTKFKNFASCDVEFALNWANDKRRWLDKNVLHLGEPKTNWNGRRTKRWD
jgi:glycosyltransferase involved in cell wall biosynthesis